jgi:hypothetical protein
MSSRKNFVIFPKVTNNLPEKGTRQSKRGIAATRLQQCLSRSGICSSDRQTTSARILVAKFAGETLVPRSNLGPRYK